jgi:hypothetical protein
MPITASNNPFECVPVVLTRFVGEFHSLVALQAAYPTAASGSYAIVNESGTDVVYNYSLADNQWFTNTNNAGGSTPYNASFIFDETSQIVPAGFTGIITNLNNIYSDVTFTLLGTNLTVTGGMEVDEKGLINGKY